MLRALPFILLACGSTQIDSGEPTDSQDDYVRPSTNSPCADEDLVIDPLGPSNPTVGDEWTVWLRCDGTTLTGVMVMQFDPLDFASVDDNIATFLMVGTGELSIQVGSYRASMDVTVTD